MAKVLVIDDDSIVLDVMVDILEQKSHCVLSASDGQQGLDSFQAEPQDVVITDIQLSVKTGLDMIRELRDRHPDVKLIATASLGHPFLARAIDAGAHRNLAKPFRVKGLLELVDEVLELKE